MLRQKWARYACKIVKDGYCVNQNVVKEKAWKPEITTYLEKKGTVKKAGIRGRPSTTDSPSKER